MKDNSPVVVRFPFGIFFWVFVFVFTLVFGISVVTTALEPKSYAAAARVEVKHKSSDDGAKTRSKNHFYDSNLAKTESEIVMSEVVMRKLIGGLDLNVAWGKKYFAGETLKTWETLAILKGRTSIRPIPDTTLISVCLYDDNPEDAALLANSLAKAYTSYVATNRTDLEAQIIDSAYAMKTPVRPNKALNYLFGILIGGFLGLLAGAGIALAFFIKNRRASKVSVVNPPQTGIPDPPP
jgi:capsular polysaccharide biosynthesis protein